MLAVGRIGPGFSLLGRPAFHVAAEISMWLRFCRVKHRCDGIHVGGLFMISPIILDA